MEDERYDLGRVALALTFAGGLDEAEVGAVRTKLRRLRALGVGQASRPDGLTTRDVLALALGMELLQFGLAAERVAALMTRGHADPVGAVLEEWSGPQPKERFVAQFPRRLGGEDDREVNGDPLSIVTASDLAAWLEDDSDAVGRLLAVRVRGVVRRLQRGLQRASLR